MTEEQQMQDEQDRINRLAADAEFDAMLGAEIETQMNEEQYIFESMMNVCGIPPEFFGEPNEENLFHQILSDERDANTKIQY